MIGHELGHIYLAEKQKTLDDKKEELYADDYALKMLEHSCGSIINLNNDEEELINDIQSESCINKLIEDIELLFLFYDMYFYASEILGYIVEEDTSHPNSIERREYLKRYYNNEKQTNLLDYAESLSDRIKEEMKKSHETD